MSDASSAVTYTPVYTDSEPWRYYGEDSAEIGPSRVIVYGYDRLLIHAVASPSPDYVPGPEHPPSPDYDQPLPADASPIAASPDYVADSDLEEDPEDDQADYPADGGMHLAPADSSAVPIVDLVLPARETEALEADEPTHAPGSPISIPFSQTRLHRARKTVRPKPSMSASIEACIARHAALPSPPLLVPSLPLPLPSPLTTSPTDIGVPLGYRAAEIRMRALLPSTSRRTDIPEADMSPRKRACLTTPAPGFKIGESFAAGAARQPRPTQSGLRRCRAEQAGYGITDTWDEIVVKLIEIAPTTLEGVNERVTELDTTEFIHSSPCQDFRDISCCIDYLDYVTADLVDYDTWMHRERDANMSMNGDNSNDSGTGGRRQMTTPRECSYTNFLKYQSMSFQGTEGVVGLTRWLEKMESVFQISNCTVACQVKFACCTLQGSALTWWNSQIRAVGQDVAYAMPWAALKRMITSKYCPRGEIQKLESEFWNLKVKERYIGGLPDKIHVSVKASKPQSMQEAIEFATEMVDKKTLTHPERQAEQKRKLDDTSRNNKHQQQPFKRNNVARVYTAGLGDKKPYGGIKPLCSKGITCFECGVQGHYKSECPKLKNGNQGNRAGNGNAVARAYAVGTAETNPNSNVVT
nr:hypothetical protein [Tanacetum cinerariifolium]